MPTSRLTTRHLRRMQAVMESSLPDTATVRRPTAVKNAVGGTTSGWTTAYTALPCHSQSRILREIKEDDAGASIRSGVRWVVRFAYGTVVELDDELDITERNGATYTLRVTSLLSPHSYGTAFGVQCIRVQ